MTLSHAERGRLGGLTAAHKMTPEQRRKRSLKGGEATLEKLGKAHYVRMAYVRLGKVATEK